MKKLPLFYMIRELCRLTIDEVSQKSGIDKTRLHQLEYGERLCTAYECKTLADIYKIDDPMILVKYPSSYQTNGRYISIQDIFAMKYPDDKDKHLDYSPLCPDTRHLRKCYFEFDWNFIDYYINKHGINMIKVSNFYTTESFNTNMRLYKDVYNFISDEHFAYAVGIEEEVAKQILSYDDDVNHHGLVDVDKMYAMIRPYSDGAYSHIGNTLFRNMDSTDGIGVLEHIDDCINTCHELEISPSTLLDIEFGSFKSMTTIKKLDHYVKSIDKRLPINIERTSKGIIILYHDMMIMNLSIYENAGLKCEMIDEWYINDILSEDEECFTKSLHDVIFIPIEDYVGKTDPGPNNVTSYVDKLIDSGLYAFHPISSTDINAKMTVIGRALTAPHSPAWLDSMIENYDRYQSYMRTLDGYIEMSQDNNYLITVEAIFRLIKHYTADYLDRDRVRIASERASYIGLIATMKSEDWVRGEDDE